MGAISYDTGSSVIHINEGVYYNSDGVILLLQDLMDENKDKKLAIFWDNASIHKSVKT